MGRYEDAFRRSLDDPAGFWAEAAGTIDWYTKPETILDDSNPPFYCWYKGGTLSTCHNALDRHVDNGHGDQPALIYDSPVTGTKRVFTFAALRNETARFAGVLTGLGIVKGDRVVIYLPMIPEAVIAMRSMRNIYDTHQGEVFWAASDIGWVVGHSYIVYAPLLAGCTTILYEGKPVGTPDAGAFWRVIAEHKVKTLFTAPTGFRAIRKEDPTGSLKQEHDLTRFRYLFLAGERLDPETYRWAGELLNVPVIDHWWQTETGWAIVADPMGLDPKPTKPGSPSLPVPGYDVQILDSDGNQAKPGEAGNIAIKLPLPPGCLPTLWHNDEGFRRSYLSRYPGYYLTGDGGFKDSGGYLYVMGRIDDVINVAGHRLSTGEMEEVLASHSAVAECAVFGVNDALKGEVPRGLVVLKSGVTAEPERLAAELAQMIRDRIGPIAALSRLDIVPGLPKTRSGKILRKTMRGLANGKDEPVPSTIDDPSVLENLRPILRGDSG